jgi:hypothetical protein
MSFKNTHGDPIEIKFEPNSSVELDAISNITGEAIPLKSDRDGFQLMHLAKPLNIYDEILSYSRHSEIQNDFVYGINTERVTVTTASGGTVTGPGDATATFQTDTTATSKAVITTKEFLKIQSGEVLDVYISAAFGIAGTNNIQEIGLGSATDGVFFAQDDNGLYLFTRNNSVDTAVRQADWNTDIMDGTGISGMTLDPLKLNTYRIEYEPNSAYEFYIKNQTNPEWNLVHRINVGNVYSIPLLRLPMNFICIANRNTAISSAGSTLKCSAISVFNSGPEIFRGLLESKAHTKTLSTQEPIISFKNKSTFAGLSNKITEKVISSSIASDGTKTVIIEIILNTTLNTPSWVDLDVTNSPLQYDISSTTVSGGTVLTTFILSKVDSLVDNIDKLNIRLSKDDTISVVGTSASNSDVTASLTFVDNN